VLHDASTPVTINGSLEATLWNPDEAAAAAQVTKSVIAWWAHRGYLARVNSKKVRTPLYRASDVLATESAVRSRRTVNSVMAA